MRPFVSLILFSLAVVFVFWCASLTKTGKKFLVWSVKKSVMFAFDDEQFRNFYDGKCLLKNTFIRSDVDVDQCELCESSQLGEMNDSATEDLIDFLHWDIPVVVKDSSYRSDTDVYKFAHAFLSDRDLAMFHPCQFKSNIKSKLSEHRQLLQMLSLGRVTSFYALWENCAEMSLKAFRQFYSRPSFLGNNIQLTGTNWAFVCLDYVSRRFKDIETFSQLVVMFVQKGTAEVRLSPAQMCADICSTISTTLVSGDTLLFSGTLYSLSIRSECHGAETVVIGVGGNFD